MIYSGATLFDKLDDSKTVSIKAQIGSSRSHLTMY